MESTTAVQPTVRYVDPSRHTTASKGHDIQRSKVWSQELIFLEFSRPWELSQQILGRLNQLLELGAHGFVDYCHKPCSTGWGRGEEGGRGVGGTRKEGERDTKRAVRKGREEGGKTRW